MNHREQEEVRRRIDRPTFSGSSWREDVVSYEDFVEKYVHKSVPEPFRRARYDELPAGARNIDLTHAASLARRDFEARRKALDTKTSHIRDPTLSWKISPPPPVSERGYKGGTAEEVDPYLPSLD